MPRGTVLIRSVLAVLGIATCVTFITISIQHQPPSTRRPTPPVRPTLRPRTATPQPSARTTAAPAPTHVVTSPFADATTAVPIDDDPRPTSRPSCGEWCADVCGTMEADRLVKSSDVPAHVLDYINKHVLFAVVTGSFEKFFRVDVALCTWIRHVPGTHVVVVSDNATRALSQVRGTPAEHRHRVHWIEGVLPPGVTFSAKQLGAKGYTVGWIRAQFRFIQGLEALAAIADVPGYDSRGFNLSTVDAPKASIMSSADSAAFEPRWFVVLDDDTFTALGPLVRMLRSYDAKLCQRRAKTSNTKVSSATNKSSSSSPVAEDACAGVDRSTLKATYVGERGWGGAGHIFNYAAVAAFLKDGYEPCVDRNMVTKFYASDVALKKCLPGAGVDVVADDRMSHCQATFLRERMLSGHHATSHVKREIDKHPRYFAQWRLRLYYQAMYQANRSAYALLMDVGACAYGSCKIGKCQQPHDVASTQRFLTLSRNNTVQPWL